MASSAWPAAISSSWISTISCPLVPIRPQLRTRRTVPNRSPSIMRLQKRRIPGPVDPVQHQLVLDRRLEIVRHHDPCWQLCKSRPPSKSATPSFRQRRLFGEAVGADQALVPQQRVKSLPVRSRHDVIGLPKFAGPDFKLTGDPPNNGTEHLAVARRRRIRSCGPGCDLTSSSQRLR